MEMSVGEETVKTGGGGTSSETNQAPSLVRPPLLQQCAETQRNSSNTSTMTTEAPSVPPSSVPPGSAAAAAAADLPASSPVLSSLMEQNHTISLDARSNNPENGAQKSSNNNNNNSNARGNENRIYRRNSFSQSKQQQQQKVNKRRNTSNFGFKHPGAGGGGKRRRRANSESDSVLPSNFLLGGNIFDPLNLNSLLDEEVSKTINAETPKSSPLPSKSRDPVEILIPRDITDPLNLNSGLADRRGFLAGPFRTGGARRRHRNRHHGGGGGGGAGGGGGISTTHVEFSESSGGRNGGEVKANATAAASSLPLSTSASSAASCPAAPDDPKGGGGACTLPSRVPGDSHGSKEAERTTSSREEVAAPCVSSAPHVRAQSADEYSSSSATTTTNQQQHSSRRKRRRNSGKMEAPSRLSTSSSTTSSAPPAPAKPPAGGRPGGGGDHRASSGKSTQSSSSFHTPRPSGAQGGAGRPQQQKKKQPHKVFQYGNYNKYYGYRNPGSNEDSRVRALRRHWFEGKDVLDLGCNSGHLTLYIAKALKPAHILGLDIDKNLIYMARKNIRHYLSAELQTQGAARRAGTSTRKEEANGKDTLAGREENQDRRLDGSAAENGNAVGPERGGEGAPPPAEEAQQSSSRDPRRPALDNGKEPRPPPPPPVEEDEVGIQTERMDCGKAPAAVAVSSSSAVKRASNSFSFPVSLQISRGPIAAPPLTETPTVRPGEFPSNVSFIKANYVLENDSLLLTQRAEYDVVMCMSVTKWIHLNWGDGGLKRLFHRVYRHLRPGGLFILEPQPWDSYARRKKLTETIFRNYHSIRLKPEQFSVFLTSEVGFSSYELIGTPECKLRGFQRPIYLFHK